MLNISKPRTDVCKQWEGGASLSDGKMSNSEFKSLSKENFHRDLLNVIPINAS